MDTAADPQGVGEGEAKFHSWDPEGPRCQPSIS